MTHFATVALTATATGMDTKAAAATVRVLVCRDVLAAGSSGALTLARRLAPLAARVAAAGFAAQRSAHLLGSW